eukprot:7683203-Ditylum_brightwellii.AAC.1
MRYGHSDGHYSSPAQQQDYGTPYERRSSSTEGIASSPVTADYPRRVLFAGDGGASNPNPETQLSSPPGTARKELSRYSSYESRAYEPSPNASKAPPASQRNPFEDVTDRANKGAA